MHIYAIIQSNNHVAAAQHKEFQLSFELNSRMGGSKLCDFDRGVVVILPSLFHHLVFVNLPPL